MVWFVCTVVLSTQEVVAQPESQLRDILVSKYILVNFQPVK